MSSNGIFTEMTMCGYIKIIFIISIPLIIQCDQMLTGASLLGPLKISATRDSMRHFHKVIRAC